MTDQNDETQKPKIQADNKSVAVGSIAVGGSTGDINIHAGDIGYSVEEVSILLTQITSTFQPKPFDGRCPYKGLDVFDEEDAELFFGREKLVGDLVSRVKNSRTLFVTGPSGSGKSSLVRAGLIPALKQGGIRNSERWLYETLKPGRDPIGEVARVASGLASSTNAEDEIRAKAMADETIFARWCEIALKDSREKRAVIFIDQFEEVFTQINKEEDRVAFLNLLTHAAAVENGRVILLFAMRSDFVSNCATYPKLNEFLGKQFIQIGSMQPQELVSAIAQPALRVGLRINPDLIAQIINDMKGEPGTLPLMQFALKELLDTGQAKGGIIALTLSDYLEREGIQKMLARHADDTFAQLSEYEQELAHSIFTGLIEIGRGTQDTRRTALFDELVPANIQAEDVGAIVQKLADARLITTDEQAGKDTVTISHEKLIDAWPWLKKLVNENRDVIALQNEIASDAKEWDDHKRDESYLYTGARLANAREKAKEIAFSGNAQAFLEASVDAQEQRRRLIERRRRWVMAGLISTALVMAALAFWGVSQASRANANAATAQAERDNALQKEQIARANELAARAKALGSTRISLSLLLSIEAYKKADTSQTRDSLLTALTTYPQIKRLLFTPEGQYFQSNAQKFSTDGKLIAATIPLENGESDILIWSIETGEVIHRIHVDWSFIYATDFSDDGTKIAASTCFSLTKICEIALWETSTGREINRLIVPDVLFTTNIALSSNGDLIAIPICAEYEKTQKACVRGQIKLIEADTGKSVGKVINIGQNIPSYVSFVPDQTDIFLIGCKDGQSCDQKEAIYINTETRLQITKPLPPETNLGPVSSNYVSPKGLIILTRKIDQSAADTQSDTTLLEIIVWDVLAQREKAIYTIPLQDKEQGYNLAINRDGDVVALHSINSLNSLTILKFEKPEARLTNISVTTYPDILGYIELAPSGEMFLAQIGGAALSDINPPALIIGNTDENVLQQNLPSDSDQVFATAYNPDGKSFVTSTCELWGTNKECIKGGIIFWDAATLKPIMEHKHLDVFISFLEYTKDGKLLVSVDADGSATIWNAKTYTKIVSSNQPMWDYSNIAVSPNGKILAVAADGSAAEDPIYFFDTDHLMPIDFGPALFEGIENLASPFSSIAFNPSGNLIAWVDGGFGKILVSNLDERKTVAELINHGSAEIVVFSTDGSLMISGGWDGTVMFWDSKTFEPIGEVLRVVDFEQTITGLKLSSDGSSLFVESVDKRLTSSRDTARAGWAMAGLVTIIDVKNRQRVGLPIPVSKIGMSINTDGTKLLTPGSVGNLDLQSWLDLACKVSSRNFTRVEWTQYFPEEEYRATCSQWALEPDPLVVSSDTIATRQSLAPLTRDPSAPLIDINTASLEELDSLPGISLTVAQEIIEYRKQKGPFRSTADLMYVSGMGDTKAESIQNLITAATSHLININTASLAELDSLPGISLTVAQEIIDYREQNGPFLTIEDIINVSGIGPSTFDRIKNLITLSY
jgi:competence ComEA-like helix-hairpin-helix protein